MAGDFLNLLKQTCIFMLAGQMILHFVPASQYEKYVKLMLGLMVLSQIAVPILSFGKEDKIAWFQQQVAVYEQEMESLSRQMGKLAWQEGEIDSQALLLETEKKLGDTLERENLFLVSVSAQEGKLTLVLKEKNAAIRIDSVDTIQIEKEDGGQTQEGQEDEEGMEKRKEDLTKLLAEKLSLNPSAVEVTFES